MALVPLFSARQQAKAIWITDSDPGADPANVGAGTIWFDTSSNAIKIRNLTNSAWFTAGAGSSVLAPDGSESAPGISFSNEPSTGFWRATTGVVKLSLSGNQEFAFAQATLNIYHTSATILFSDTQIQREGIGVIAQNGGSTAQKKIVYNTWTSATDFESFAVDWKATANLCKIGTDKGSGGGSARALALMIGGTTKLLVTATGSVALNGGQAALALNATDGFTYIPTCAGTPAGTPTAVTGAVPIVYDTSADQFWIYAGGAWKQPKTPAAAAIVSWQ